MIYLMELGDDILWSHKQKAISICALQAGLHLVGSDKSRFGRRRYTRSSNGQRRRRRRPPRNIRSYTLSGSLDTHPVACAYRRRPKEATHRRATDSCALPVHGTGGLKTMTVQARMLARKHGKAVVGTRAPRTSHFTGVRR